MTLKALDLLRTLGWGLIDFIFSLIDSLFEIIKEMNSFNIIDSLAEIPIFKNLHSSIITISITLFGLFVVWIFVKKIMEPEEHMSFSQTLKEIFKCGLFIILSTMLFSQVANFSISLSGFTANIFKENNTELSDDMLSLYVDYTDEYSKSNDSLVNYENLKKDISNGTFTKDKMYNNKFALLTEKDYVYKINWIMAVIIGGFFLYSLFFSGMMLARRQIEFLFLFVISPIVFATSVGNKQRRTAVIEQLVSLTLQSAAVMLIINITALIMQAVNNTVFFDNVFQDVIIKSLMFIGCGSFLLTGSQVVNRFIGGNVSANSGREQMMSLMGFGQALSTTAQTGGLALAGASMLGVGAVAKALGVTSSLGNKALATIGNKLNTFGQNISKNSGVSDNTKNIGSVLSSFGSGMETFANKRIQPKNKEGLNVNSSSNRLSRFGGIMLEEGRDSINSAINNIVPARNLYKRRYRYRDF